MAPKKKLKKKAVKKSAHSEVTYTAKPLFEYSEVPRPVPGEKLLAALQAWKNGQQEAVMSNAVEDIEQKSSQKNIKDLRLVFQCVDSSNSGFLDEPGVQNALELLGFVVNDGGQEHIRKVMVSNSGRLDFDGFQRLVADWHGIARNFYKELKKGFSVIDIDKDGKITEADLREASKLAGIHFSNKELEEMLRVADKNGDHSVDISEFVEIMLKTSLF
ncbi:uncharacterized protein [Hyperolius riggenbachi]|uniref:uncharacterized protein n=1 Tax=Hyperolius riggenbachi TaxID=752182 RepID=UPI0035A3CF00